MYTPDPLEENQSQAASNQYDHEIETLSATQNTSISQDAPLDFDSIQRGLVYPPPPAFYEQQQDVPELPPTFTPPAQAKEQTTPFITPASPSLYSSNSRQDLTKTSHPYQLYSPTPGYPPGVQPPFVTVPPRPKKSRKWLWIGGLIITLAVLLSCGACSWVAYPIITQAYQQASSAVYGSQDLVNNYYTAIQNQQYNQAYTYLTPQGSNAHLTQDQFIQQAKQRDNQYGPVYRFTPGTPSVNYNDTNGQTIDRFTISVTVARAKKTYTVQLSAQKINGAWKIDKFNQI
jgi:hypothetical protein